MTELRGFALPEQHLALDALVALVDGELSPSAHDRAVSHLARCPTCSGRATAQRQARTAVRSAAAPMMPVGLLEALCAIPQHADLPPGPDELAVTSDGQFVAVRSTSRSARSVAQSSATTFGSGAQLGSGPRLGEGDSVLGGGRRAGQERVKGMERRMRNSAGVVVSGLVLGAVALVIPVEQPERIQGNATFGAESNVGGASAGIGASAPKAYDMGATPDPVAPVASQTTDTPSPEIVPQSINGSAGAPAASAPSVPPTAVPPARPTHTAPVAPLGAGLLPAPGLGN
ncbi:anti-sigma factor family protein [Actinoalloteichus hymeniacidonis]|uniref:Zinc-finger n=1 Tax=Actinoalloteichus hymeniacidonis TaxID=340345 RepID=A0AAC9HMW9_9PSEU|nr:zf-HC2 domain-containing protein [Actinoalloteichus hymeniacidonis]AOS61760.1 Putative zinc-finger [Actinoalloteichus hymeniacidonis]MBB5910222.1 anti-sigma factor RsiW [Actinoalloteichus hymeniacidonis]